MKIVLGGGAMGRRWAGVAVMAALFVCGVFALVAAARGQMTGKTVDGRMEALDVKAPEFPAPGDQNSGITWIDSPALTLASLRGKVVMIDFWEYTCINCIRTFPQNKIWYERYKPYGFEIIGVHDPEFEVAYDVENVKAAVERFGLPYPIVVDDYFTIWKAFSNQVWPERYLIDAKGNVRFKLEGEGDDHNFEVAIRQLLIEAHPGLKFPASDTLPVPDNAADCAAVPTLEMYVGSWHGEGRLANPQGYHGGETINYKMPEKVNDGYAAVSGKWETDPNGMIYEGKTQEPKQDASRLRVPYHATEIYAVMNVAQGKPERLYILQDGKPLTAENKGADVKIDDKGQSYIDVDSSRMYYLVSNAQFSSHVVDLIPTAPGIMIDSFTFGNDCQRKFPHV
jgi:thiol-disulfide isomerase/thioredoxin